MSAMDETLKIKIGLSGTFHDKRPEYSVLINETEYISGLVSSDSESVFFVEFFCRQSCQCARQLLADVD